MINRNCLVNDPYYCHPSRPTNHCWWTTTLSSKKLSKNAWLIIFQHFSIQIKEWLQVQNASFKTSFNIGVGVGEWGRAISEWENYNSRTQSDLIIPVPSRFLFLENCDATLGPGLPRQTIGTIGWSLKWTAVCPVLTPWVSSLIVFSPWTVLFKFIMPFG